MVQDQSRSSHGLSPNAANEEKIRRVGNASTQGKNQENYWTNEISSTLSLGYDLISFN